MDIENSVIQQFHVLFSQNKPIDINFINYIENDFPNSLVLNYYLGMYWKRMGNLETAKEMFYKAISINQLFVPPYIELGSGLESPVKMQPLLERIWNRKTFHNGKLVFQLELQLRICSLLVCIYESDKDKIKIYNIILTRLEKEFEIANPVHWQCWKTMWKSYGEIVRHQFPEKGVELMLKGLSKRFPYSNDKVAIAKSLEGKIYNMDKSLVQAIYLSRFYTLKPINLPNSQEYYKFWTDNKFKHDKIRSRESKSKVIIASTDGSRLSVREKIRMKPTDIIKICTLKHCIIIPMSIGSRYTI